VPFCGYRKSLCASHALLRPFNGSIFYIPLNPHRTSAKQNSVARKLFKTSTKLKTIGGKLKITTGKLHKTYRKLKITGRKLYRCAGKLASSPGPPQTVAGNANTPGRQGCIKLPILSPRGTSGERTEEGGCSVCQLKCASSPQPSPPSDGGEGKFGSLKQPGTEHARPRLKNLQEPRNTRTTRKQRE
jgi:hypothetical protein